MQTENDGTAIFKLLACKDEMLLVARDPGVDVEGQGLASDDDLHQSNALQLVRKSKKNKQKWTYLASGLQLVALWLNWRGGSSRWQSNWQ